MVARDSSHDPLERLLSRSLQRQVSAAEECPDAELLAAYGDSERSSSEAESVERHVSGCSRCLRIVTLAANSMPVPAQADASSAWRMWGLWQWVVPAAAVVVIAALWVATTRREVTEIAAVTPPASERPGAPAVLPPPASGADLPSAADVVGAETPAAQEKAAPPDVVALTSRERRRQATASEERSSITPETFQARADPQTVTGAVSGLPPTFAPPIAITPTSPTFRSGLDAVPGGVPGGVPADSLSQGRVSPVPSTETAKRENAQEVSFTLSGKLAESEVVNVKGSPATVDVQNARQQQVFTGEELRDLPTTRDLASLANLVP